MTDAIREDATYSNVDYSNVGYSNVGYSNGDYSNWAGDTTTHWDLPTDLSGIAWGSSTELDFGWPISFVQETGIEYNWFQQEIQFDFGLGVTGGQLFLDQFVTSEFQAEAGFVQNILGDAISQIGNVLDNSIGMQFYTDTADNLSNMYNNIVGFHENRWEEISSGFNEMFLF